MVTERPEFVSIVYRMIPFWFRWSDDVTVTFSVIQFVLLEIAYLLQGLIKGHVNTFHEYELCRSNQIRTRFRTQSLKDDLTVCGTVTWVVVWYHEFIILYCTREWKGTRAPSIEIATLRHLSYVRSGGEIFLREEICMCYRTCCPAFIHASV